MVKESRDEMIRRLRDEIVKLLEERLPDKGSTIDEIERITEELGREIERKIEESVTRQEGRGYVGSLAPCKCLVQARLKQAGMRWSPDGAASMLQLRRLWLDNPQANFGQYAAMAV